MPAPDHKWAAHIPRIHVDSLYSRVKVEEIAFGHVQAQFKEFVSNWRKKIKSELDEQMADLNAYSRVAESGVLNDWIFSEVDEYEKAGLKMIRIDETDRADYVEQWGKNNTDMNCTAFIVPCKESNVPAHYYYGSVKKEMVTTH